MSRLGHSGGLTAEDTAATVYTALGGHVLQHRFKTEAGEIDLIVELNGTVVFVEVKARKSLDEAAFSLSDRQMSRIRIAAEIYLGTLDHLPDTQFDVILIDHQGRTKRIENAF
jgi:putative endonuclease